MTFVDYKISEKVENKIKTDKIEQKVPKHLPKNK